MGTVMAEDFAYDLEGQPSVDLPSGFLYGMTNVGSLCHFMRYAPVPVSHERSQHTTSQILSGCARSS